MQGLADPNHFILAIPLIMLKYATREQLLTKNFSGITPFEVLCQSYIPTINTKSISGIYPAVKEAYVDLQNSNLKLAIQHLSHEL
jgi:hypothetical protein